MLNLLEGDVVPVRTTPWPLSSFSAQPWLLRLNVDGHPQSQPVLTTLHPVGGTQGC